MHGHLQKKHIWSLTLMGCKGRCKPSPSQFPSRLPKDYQFRSEQGFRKYQKKKRNTVRLSEFQYLLGPSSKWIDFIIVFPGHSKVWGQISHGLFGATLELRMADIQWTEKLCPKVKHLNHAKKPRILCKTDMEFALKKPASFEMRTQTFAVVKKLSLWSIQCSVLWHVCPTSLSRIWMCAWTIRVLSRSTWPSKVGILSKL